MSVHDKLSHIKDLTWDDVFEVWRANEESRPNWEALYRERGYTTWEEWRRPYARALELNKKDWALYHIDEPIKTSTLFHGGPFRGWIDRFYDSDPHPSFGTLVENVAVSGHTGIRDILNHFPNETTLTGLSCPFGIAIIEGMHRTAALALAHKERLSLTGNVFIALAQDTRDILPVIGGMRKN